jgi:hypothetical protein
MRIWRIGLLGVAFISGFASAHLFRTQEKTAVSYVRISRNRNLGGHRPLDGSHFMRASDAVHGYTMFLYSVTAGDKLIM